MIQQYSMHMIVPKADAARFQYTHNLLFVHEGTAQAALDPEQGRLSLAPLLLEATMTGSVGVELDLRRGDLLKALSLATTVHWGLVVRVAASLPPVYQLSEGGAYSRPTALPLRTPSAFGTHCFPAWRGESGGIYIVVFTAPFSLQL